MAAVVLIAACDAGTAAAQPPAGRIEVAAGAAGIGAMSFDPVAANETTLGSGTRALFDTRTQLDGSIGAGLTFGVRLTDLIRAEATVAYNPTHLTTRVTSDTEGVPDVAVDTKVTQYIVGGDILAQPSRWRRGRLAPFVTLGAGYLRQLSDGRTLVQTGTAYFGGGGLFYQRVVEGRRLKATGIRVDVRALALRDGVSLDRATRVTPAVTASLFARF
jgi:hypothetical protein